MKIFSTRRTYDLVTSAELLTVVENLPIFTPFAQLKDLKYDFISKDEKTITLQITESFDDDFVPPGSGFVVADQQQLITVPRTDTNADLPNNMTSFNGLFMSPPQSWPFFHVIPIETNEFVNKFLFINGAFFGA